MEKLLREMKENPKADWKPRDARTAARRHGLKLCQRGTGYAVLTNAQGKHLAILMHSPSSRLTSGAW